MFGFAKRAKNLYVASFNFNLLYTVGLRDCKTLQGRQPLASFYESHLLQIRVESSPQLVFYARWSSLSALAWFFMDSWFASQNTSRNPFCVIDPNCSLRHQLSGVWGQFTSVSVREAAPLDGLDRNFASAWNELGFKGEKAVKKAQKVWIANWYSGATVGPWLKQQTYLGAGGDRGVVVQQDQIAVPQTLLNSKYFQAVNRIDNQEQYRHCLLAIVLTWFKRVRWKMGFCRLWWVWYSSLAMDMWPQVPLRQRNHAPGVTNTVVLAMCV